MTRCGLALGAAACLAALAGCGPAGLWREHFRDTLAGEKAVPRKLSSPRELAMFDGHDGAALAWDDLLEAVRLADVVAVGEPHTDFDGGLVRRIRRGDADLTVLTISLVPAHSRRLRRDDRGRADVVIYTGAQ